VLDKFAALVLGVMLASSAGTAFAASPVEFEGFAKVYHESLSNFQRASYGDAMDRESFFENMLQIAVTFRPNDRVSVHWQFRGPEYQRWGDSRRSTANIFTRALYGEAIFPWGTIRAGRIPEGMPGTSAGLSVIGYYPTWGREFLYIYPFDPGDPIDGISFTKKWDNGFGLNIMYSKNASYWGNSRDNYAWNGPFQPAAFGSYDFKDSDHDSFGIEPTYEWEGGGATLGLSFSRDMTDPTVEKDYAVFVNPSIFQSWGDFALHFEAKIGRGKTTYSRKSALIPPDRDSSISSSGFGLYLDGKFNYGSGDVTLAAWYASGTSPDDDGNRSLVIFGGLAPFLVAFNLTTLDNGTYSNNLGWGGYGMTYASDAYGDRVIQGNRYNGFGVNVWGVSLLGNHQLTPEIKLNYGIGYFGLAAPNFRFDLSDLDLADPAPAWKDQSRDLGWEIDLGATFQITDNLWFESQFGYMFNGKAFDFPEFDGNGVYAGMAGAKDTFAWASVLSFDF
jgi:hypothetical protein